MIRSESQLRHARSEILRLRQRLEDLRKRKLGKELRAMQEAGLARMLRTLGDQVHRYEEALRGRVSRSTLEHLLSPEENAGRPRIGEAMVLLRVARGMTQEDLARKLRTKREVVARWERDDYDGYTLESLRSIFEALGCQVALRVRTAG